VAQGIVVTTLFIGSLVIFIGSLLQGAIGFGFSMVTVPFLVLLLPRTVMTPVLVLLCVALNLMATLKSRQHLRLSGIVLPLLAGGIAGVPAGILLLRVVDATMFRLGVGGVVLLLSLLLMADWKRPVIHQAMGLLPVGLVSGLLNGSIALSGPPAILFLSNQEIPRDQFRANLLCYFLFLNCATALSFALSGMVGIPALRYTAVYTPAMVAGTIAGMLLADRIPEKLFRTLTLYIVGGMGLWLIVSTLIKT
jgi:uncharacterized membrane protein YfcA